MKPVVVVFGLFVMLAVHVTAQDTLISIKNRCKLRTRITDAAVNNIKLDGGPKTRKEQCFVGCLSHELGVVFPNNKINIEEVKLRLAKVKRQNPDAYQKTLKIIEDCASKLAANSDECEAAKNNMKCFFRGLKKIGLKIRFAGA